jgi:nitrite reductase (NADH) small subunit
MNMSSTDARALMETAATQWVDACQESDLATDRGVCALIHDMPIAIFRVSPHNELFAVSNIDPFTSASVMSRGLVGSKGAVVKVASPMLKHAFDLRTGISLDDPTVALTTFAVRIVEGIVQIEITALQ